MPDRSNAVPQHLKAVWTAATHVLVERDSLRACGLHDLHNTSTYCAGLHHRYYGKSLPFPAKYIRKHMEFLSAEQVRVGIRGHGDSANCMMH